MANRDVVAVGTSAGGVKALLYLAKRFPRDFPAAVFVTIHLPSEFRSDLDRPFHLARMVKLFNQAASIWLLPRGIFLRMASI